MFYFVTPARGTRYSIHTVSGALETAEVPLGLDPTGRCLE